MTSQTALDIALSRLKGGLNSGLTTVVENVDIRFGQETFPGVAGCPTSAEVTLTFSVSADKPASITRLREALAALFMSSLPDPGSFVSFSRSGMDVVRDDEDEDLAAAGGEAQADDHEEEL